MSICSDQPVCTLAFSGALGSSLILSDLHLTCAWCTDLTYTWTTWTLQSSSVSLRRLPIQFSAGRMVGTLTSLPHWRRQVRYFWFTEQRKKWGSKLSEISALFNSEQMQKAETSVSLLLLWVFEGCSFAQASCVVEAGLEMLKQIEILTGLPFVSPTGIIGQYNHSESGNTEIFFNSLDSLVVQLLFLPGLFIGCHEFFFPFQFRVSGCPWRNQQGLLSCISAKKSSACGRAQQIKHKKPAWQQKQLLPDTLIRFTRTWFPSWQVCFRLICSFSGCNPWNCMVVVWTDNLNSRGIQFFTLKTRAQDPFSASVLCVGWQCFVQCFFRSSDVWRPGRSEHSGREPSLSDPDGCLAGAGTSEEREPCRVRGEVHVGEGWGVRPPVHACHAEKRNFMRIHHSSIGWKSRFETCQVFVCMHAPAVGLFPETRRHSCTNRHHEACCTFSPTEPEWKIWRQLARKVCKVCFPSTLRKQSANSCFQVVNI